MKTFNEIYSIDCSKYVEQVNKLNYLSWANAWQLFKNEFPDATYQIKRYGENQLPYVFDEATGYMVFTSITANGETQEMWLPVMDSSNNAMLNVPYEYKVKKYAYANGKSNWNGEYDTKTVAPATMFDINKTIMRCLTKNMAMFGLGLYIYAGEDLPNTEEDKVTVTKAQPKVTTTQTTSGNSSYYFEINNLIKGHEDILDFKKINAWLKEHFGFPKDQLVKINELTPEQFEILKKKVKITLEQKSFPAQTDNVELADTPKKQESVSVFDDEEIELPF